MGTQRIVIVGGGVGGLSLAAALRHRGIEHVVLERAPELTVVGAGLTIQPNALTALSRIGLAEAVIASGAVLHRGLIRKAAGATLSEMDTGGFAERFGQPIVALHRARLQQALARAIDPGAIHTGFAAERYEDSSRGVVVHGADGRAFEGTLLVGADGLRSVVRAALVGETPLVYSGYTSWRGISPRADLVEDGCATETWGAGQRFGLVPIGHGEVYWFATADAPVGEKDPEPALESVVARFQGWHAPVAEVLGATPPDQLIRTDIHDRDPIPHWSGGRVVLLGDAAHPMTPNMGQGACQAIEDAVVLAAALAADADHASALRTYEAKRVARANAVVMKSRTIGKVGQWRSPPARAFRELALRLTPASATLRSLEPVLTFDG